MPFCRICLFALVCCACGAAEQKKALDASQVALDAAACARAVADAYATADVKQPEIALALAADIEKCAAPLADVVEDLGE